MQINHVVHHGSACVCCALVPSCCNRLLHCRSLNRNQIVSLPESFGILHVGGHL